MTRTSDLRGENVIDSRDVMKRYEELNDEREGLIDAIAEAKEELEELNDPTNMLGRDKEEIDAKDTAINEAKTALDEWDAGDEGYEYKALQSLIDEAEGYGDWKYGETLIKDEYFEEYAQELAEDIGALENCNNWPATCIDWARAADELKQDYMQVEFGDDTYWMRA